MKLLLVTPACARGGAEEYVAVLARGALARGHDVTVACSHVAALDELAEELARDGAEVRRVPLHEGPDQLPLRARIDVARQLLRDTRPDAVHLTLPWPDQGLPTMIAAALARVPLMAVFQNIAEPLVIPWRWPVYHWVRRRRQRWVAVSAANRAALARTFAMRQDTFCVIRNGGDLADGCGSDVHAELGIAAETPLILTVGRLDHQKGQDRIIAGAGGILRAHPAAHFVWVGDGPMHDRLADALREHGLQEQVTMLGRRTDVPRLLAAATVFLFPSRFEGMPFALIEAMHAGLAIVTTAAGGIPELVRHGREGLVVDGDDPGALGDAVVSLLRDPQRRRELGAAARERAAAFGTGAMIDATLAELFRLAHSEDPA